LEGSHPGDDRIQLVSLEEVRPFIDEAVTFGVRQLSFTGGEPFVNREMAAILDLALDHRPCMVLTNATKPLVQRLEAVRPLVNKPNPLRFRVSLDYPDPDLHDSERGTGNFELALMTLGELHRMGFPVSVARLAEANEDSDAVNQAYGHHFERAGVPASTHIQVFPDFHTPGSLPNVPHITEQCMTTYHDVAGREAFMCNASKMVIKKGGMLQVYACTLVDDDSDYALGQTLRESMRPRVMLKHHRCYSCFAHGATCSER
jgi:hypothetical protein